ncbi:MAG: hypothetical protein JJU36_12935 [Phycisphaeraceae bacterium]|nr:hypothetical protein [Phycisphaeraceae bacterium]
MHRIPFRALCLIGALLSATMFGCDGASSGGGQETSRQLTDADHERAQRLLEAVLAGNPSTPARSSSGRSEPIASGPIGYSERRVELPLPGVEMTIDPSSVRIETGPGPRLSKPEPKEGHADPDEFEKYFLRIVDELGRIGHLLANIHSTSQAQAAAPQLRTIAERALTLANEAESLGIVSDDLENWLNQKHEARIKNAFGMLLTHGMRLQHTPAGPIIEEALRPLEDM